MDFLALMREVGFEHTELVADTGFNSSPVTKGVLLRATKPAVRKVQERGTAMEGTLSKYQTFFDSAYAEGVLDRKTKHLIALGASLGAGCED